MKKKINKMWIQYLKVDVQMLKAFIEYHDYDVKIIRKDFFFYQMVYQNDF